MTKHRVFPLLRVLDLLLSGNEERRLDNDHLSDQQVFGYIARSLEDSDRRDLEKHFETCGECSKHISEVQQLFGAWENEAGLEPLESLERNVSANRVPSAGKHSLQKATAAFERHQRSSKRRHKEQSKMPTKKPFRSRSAGFDYFSQQLQIDVREKQQLARYVLREYPLRSHAGVVIDAGSTAFRVWQPIREGLVSGRYTNLTVMTNNFEVLTDWIETQRCHTILGTTVDVAGGIFDASHRAFYGSQERKKVSSMLLSFVYVGIAGLEMDDLGRFLIGYHSEPFEMHSKLVLFQSPCEARFLLATSRKIGYAGSRALDLFAIPKANWKAPIYLISNTPANDTERDTFDRIRRSLLEGAVRDRLLERRITFHWSIVDCSKDDPTLVDDITVSPGVFTELGKQVDDLDRCTTDEKQSSYRGECRQPIVPGTVKKD